MNMDSHSQRQAKRELLMCWLWVPEELLPKVKNKIYSMLQQAESKKQFSSFSSTKAITMIYYTESHSHTIIISSSQEIYM